MSAADFTAKVTLEAELFPSEDPAKVEGALRSIVGGSRAEVVLGPKSARLTAVGLDALSHIREQFRDRHVRSAARRLLMLNASGRSTSMMLNRQAAAAGVVALCGGPGESPLGPIYATIDSDDLKGVLDWLTA